MRVAVILLACVAVLVSAQFNQDIEGGSPPKGLPAPLRSARFQRLPSARPAIPTQAALANQRLTGPRRPIGTGPGPLAPFKPLRPNSPNLPTGPAQNLPQHIKPVNEEPDEDARNRESQREQDDDSELSEEQSESQEDSEENVPRAIANLGAVSRSSAGPSAQSPPVQYRPPLQTASPSTGRGGGVSATPAPQPVQYRPPPKANKPRKPIEEPFKQQVKAPPTKPVKTSQPFDGRGKKPVAQIIRRYRNDNPDGSITWGFENDDGSYKEELIGIDCITRGKYGYIDPDGIRREYTYETGIKCDEEQREEDEENGFVDYQENKLVLPDGKTIDLSSMGKKQGRRPKYVHRN
ncbi:extensin isoform X2 [Osmia bicornis bicornis]|uniref:extensin isoform X2 n=1 Tax=Osmia bicornis bicornis TaxID=1437191 RepID=UPI001EAF46BC|nr:extensin isoform X2 [Osmia bicornis bicornis]